MTWLPVSHKIRVCKDVAKTHSDTLELLVWCTDGPLLGCPKSIFWLLLATHSAWCMKGNLLYMLKLRGTL